MTVQVFAVVDHIEVVGGTECGLRTRRGPLAALGIPAPCPDRFLVLLVEDDGGQTVLWDGVSYGLAILEAERCGDDWRVPVIDRVIE